VFLLHCLLSDSPPDTPREIREVRDNLQRVAHRGRETGLLLARNGTEAPLADWAREVLAQCEPIPERIDARLGGAAYRDAYQAMLKLAADASQTPSARVLHAMARNHDNSFVRFALIESTAHKAMLQHLELPREVRERFTRLAQESVLKQRELEASDEVDFETFRSRYLAHDLLRV
jgi:glutamate--cysteine ligase